MWRFVLRRLVTMFPVVFVVVSLTFFLVRLAPGNPFAEERELPAETLARMQAHYGLDLPLHRQYLRYMGNALRGDLGPALKYPRQTVNEIIATRFPVSLELGFYGLLIALGFGITAGIAAARHAGSPRDQGIMALCMVGICIPSFVIGPLLVLLFSVHGGLLPVEGWRTPADRVLPALTLGAMYAAYVARLMRGSMLEVLPADYIRTARAKGLGERTVLWRHAVRNALLPVVSFLGPATAGIITGSFVVETIFNIPGLGQSFVLGALNRDYFLVQGLVAFYAALVVAFNLAVDLALAWLNPRIRAQTTA